ncbi:DUF1801 domain-containing protein [Saccharospirillum mangrovi]|uniref:DUF1801 domain-containing protein n=1 Tax=Saccharospirillum mangrovi TaxID=2161747 RepID=UPI000D36CF5B|nr:DUF1801 domain-containing protein [Saccharospirillum mangrovi]
MSPLFTLNNAVEQDQAVEEWLGSREGRLGELARHWFAVVRQCGPDVLEIMHDGMATACVGEAAFAYVAVYTAHLNIGFFRGAELDDPHKLLEGTGKMMRHVKVRPGAEPDEEALTELIHHSYAVIQRRLEEL